MTFAGIVAGMTFLRGISLLIARVILGVVLIAHGWQKYNDWKIEGTGKSFDGMGVPYPELSAQIATYFELIGGVLLIIGLLVRLVGPIMFVQMLGAFWFAHRDGGVFRIRWRLGAGRGDRRCWLGIGGCRRWPYLFGLLADDAIASSSPGQGIQDDGGCPSYRRGSRGRLLSRH